LTNETKQLGQAVKDSFSAGGAGELVRVADVTVACSATASPVVLAIPDGKGFDAVVLEEDLQKGNQRIASYELQTCSTVSCGDETAWVALQGFPQLGLTVGRKVIERGFSNGTARATRVRFRCTAASKASGDASDVTAYLKSFSVHKMSPPAGYVPPVPFDCKVFGCTCKGMADYYGIGPPPGLGGFGCATATAEKWWVSEAKPCSQPGYSCCAASDYTKKSKPFPGCQHGSEVGWSSQQEAQKAR
jgi:hypothetical protein